MALKGLVIRQPWIAMILNGEKTWEMRSSPCRHRGPVALIEKGTGTIVGLADLVDDLPPLSEERLTATFPMHRIPAQQIEDALRQRWVRPWVLANVRRLATPVPYQHTSGGSWVNLSECEEEAVYGVSSAFAPGNVASTQSNLPHLTDDESAERGSGQLSIDRPSLKIGEGATVSIRQRGNKLHFDARWKDNSPRRSSRPRWVEAVGLLSASIGLLCGVGFIFHFVLGVLMESISAVSAFKWLPPVPLFVMIAFLCGYEEVFAPMTGNSARP